MAERRLPVRPDLDQLKHQAKDLLKGVRAGDAAALAEFRAHHPAPPDAADATLADAQLALARAYEAPSWMRLVQACDLIDAIWQDDVEGVRTLVRQNPHLLHEHATIRDSNWGPPMSYAANLGRDRIIEALRELGARDLESAIGRAVLQSRVSTAALLHRWLGRPAPPEDALGGPAYTLSVSGTAFVFEIGGRVYADDGRQLAAPDVVLETDSRNPEAKHAILEMYVQHGLRLPDTAPMALHRGRLDLLDEHLRRDPALLTRTYSHEEIYPPEIGCHDEVLATHGTPLKGATLLHMCVDYAEMDIARWLLDRGVPVDVRAAIDADGFGGHTPLFATVVAQPNFWVNYGRKTDDAPFTRLLLERGANPHVRASLRKQLHPGYGPDTLHEYRDVTPREWGERFHNQIFVSRKALALIADAERTNR